MQKSEDMIGERERERESIQNTSIFGFHTMKYFTEIYIYVYFKKQQLPLTSSLNI